MRKNIFGSKLFLLSVGNSSFRFTFCWRGIYTHNETPLAKATFSEIFLRSVLRFDSCSIICMCEKTLLT